MRCWIAPPLIAPALLIAVALVVGSLMVAVPAQAAQDDPRLDQLFERLRETDNAAEAGTVVQLIWTIWHAYDGGRPEVPRLMIDAGVAIQDNRLARAEALYGRITELDPEFAEGWNRRATVRWMAGDFAGSVADIQQTLALEPRHFGALSGLGLIYTEMDEPERAVAAFEAALEINPYLPGARANIDMLRSRLDGDPI